MKKILILAFSLFTLGTYAQREVPQSRMEQIYEEAKTPYKYGLAVAPADNKHKIDCPTVFREGDKWYMTYVVYNGKSGLDGRGYETWIAESDNLLEWRTLGRVLSYRDGFWDCNQRGGFPALPDMEWGGSYALQTYKGKHWMTYLGGEGTGYESVNWGEKVLYDGSTLHDRDAFIYGGALTLDVEFYVADRIALLANLRERCLWGGDTRKFHTQFGVGIKFIIN